MEYTFKTEPFNHQLTALSDSWSEEYHALFMEMGTGKSKGLVNIQTLREGFQQTFIAGQMGHDP